MPANEIPRLARLEAPKIELSLTSRQPPAISMFLGYIAEISTNLRRKEIEDALSIFGDEGIQENKSLYLCVAGLGDTTDEHARITVPYEDGWVGNL